MTSDEVMQLVLDRMESRISRLEAADYDKQETISIFQARIHEVNAELADLKSRIKEEGSKAKADRIRALALDVASKLEELTELCNLAWRAWCSQGYTGPGPLPIQRIHNWLKENDPNHTCRPCELKKNS
jgi:hypothetical protein